VFPILPYDNVSKTLQRIELNADQRAEAARLMGAVLSNGFPGGGAGCHYPIHGLRFYKGKTLLYQTSLCWHCGNFFATYDPLYRSMWLGFNGGSDELKKFMNSVLPIPEEEIKRFKEARARKPKKLSTP
jgi:hypothetical protein